MEETVFAELHLNARLMPIDRGDIFEDRIDDFISERGWGEVTGGGTLQTRTGEVESCDVEIEVVPEYKDEFVDFIKRLYIIPKGSRLRIGEESFEVGESEGLALYLNGTELPGEVYQNNDINELIAELDEAVNGFGTRYSYFEGNTETALYYYGRSFSELNDRISNIVKSHPLCQKCRIVQIA